MLIFKDVYIQGIWKVGVADFTKGSSRFSICPEFSTSGGTYNAQRFLDARGIVGQILHFCHNLVEMATTECYLFSNLMFQNMSDYFFFVYCNNSL